MAKFKFIDRLASLRKREQQSQEEQWRDLIFRAATKDNLSEEEVETLDRLHHELGIDTELVEYASLLAEHHALSSAPTELEKRERLETAAVKACEKHREETQEIERAHSEIMDHRRLKATQLDNALNAHRREVKNANVTAARRTELEKSLWRFVGADDPRIEAAESEDRRKRAARIRYIVPATVDCEARYGVSDRGHRYFTFESFITGASAGNWNTPREKFDGLIFRPAPQNQTEDEALELATIARGLLEASEFERGRYRYVRSRRDGLPAMEGFAMGCIMYVEDVAGSFDPRQHQIMLYPGQSRQDRDRLVPQLIEAYEKKHASAERTRHALAGTSAY